MANSTLTQKAEKYVVALLASGTSHTIGTTKDDEELHAFEEALKKKGLLASGLVPGAYVIRNVVNGTPMLLNGYLEPVFTSLEFARECMGVLQRRGRIGMGIFQLVEKI